MGRRTILFIDEIHRFNKAQQDAFLPFVEDGTITLIGATTENPSFHVNNALLSRLRVLQLKAVDEDALVTRLEKGIAVLDAAALRGHAGLRTIARHAAGDVRIMVGHRRRQAAPA